MRLLVVAVSLLLAQSLWCADPVKIVLSPAAKVSSNGLAKTPPMGWTSERSSGAPVSDRIARETADAMVRNGMKNAGYVYVNIGDGWQGRRDERTGLAPNERFPDIKGLADYLHGKGLKLGIYSSPGAKTCGGHPGSFQHEEQDARTFAAWGIDYLKYEWCSAGDSYDAASMPAVFAKMGLSLLSSGRPALYGIAGQLPNAAEWAAGAGANLWPAGSTAESNVAPGHWSDPGVLDAGPGGMNETVYRARFSMWCLLAAPLMTGSDLRDMPPGILEILTNPEAIAVDQDSLGAQGVRVKTSGDLEIWAKPLADGGRAVGLFNRGGADTLMFLGSSDLGLKTMPTVRDLWTHEDRAEAIDIYSADVPAHGVVLLKVGGY